MSETILRGGRIVTLDGRDTVAEALAIRDDKILAVGTASEAHDAAPAARVVDLGGRTVIPGLIDSHMHAVRAALSFATEVNWIGARSIPEAMARLAEAARAKPPGAWLIVAGGWTDQQFAERRRPTRTEIEIAAPGSPVYIQLFYASALLSAAGLAALGISSEADIPPKGRFAAEGWIEGDNPTITRLFSRLPTPTFVEKLAGSRLFFRELNRLALTGVIDPGGFNLAPSEYQPLFKLWRDRQLTIRVRYSNMAQKRGTELSDFRSFMQWLPMGFGDGMLRSNGIGEQVTVGMYNNDTPTPEEQAEFYEVARWAAENRMTLTIHWPNDAAAALLLGMFERIDQEIGIRDLRWSLAHLNDATDATLARMKALGMGWAMQNAMYFQAEQFGRRRGADALARTPPIVSAIRAGLPVGGGTDAHRVMSYNPFVCLQWMLDGLSVAGTRTRAAAEIPTRAEALRLYTHGSAWFSFEEASRGTLEPGKLADLAVLSADYLTMPVGAIGGLESLLTMVGGVPVYAAGAFAGLNEG